MTEESKFFTEATLLRVDCDACGLVRCISVGKDISIADMRRLKPHILAAMGYLALPDNELSCESCSEVLASTLSRLPRQKALTVQNAMVTQMRHGLIQVSE